jgi:hypothetical protein
MLKLTAYNQDVQRYLQGGKSTRIRKATIIDIIQESVLATGKSFDRLFPNKSKRKAVMDEIIFYLSGSGICKVAAETLAKNTETSVRTVYDAVKNLKETGEILVGGLADGKNKYIFVLKSHPNFKEILREVFFIEELPVEKQSEEPVEPHSEPEQQINPVDLQPEIMQPEELVEDPSKNNHIAEHNVVEIAEHKNSETVEGVDFEGQKSSFNNINFFSFKQEKNNYKHLIENEIINACKKQNDLEYLNTYYTNEWQFELYNYIYNSNFHQYIRDNAIILGLRVGSNADKNSFLLSIKAIIKMDIFLKKGGTIETTVQALFTRLYTDLIKEYTAKPNKTIKSVTEPPKPVLVYNWLEKDGSAPIKTIVPEVELTPVSTTEQLTKEELDELGVF